MYSPLAHQLIFADMFATERMVFAQQHPHAQ